jgi:hypothetical protein
MSRAKIAGAQSENSRHLVVWLDHRLARLYALAHDAVRETQIHNSDSDEGHIHHHAGSVGAGHVALGRPFLEKISDAIDGAQEILIVGPSGAKTALKTFLDSHKPSQAGNVVAVEPMDHASDGEIVAFGRHFFARADCMMPLKS